MTQPQLSRLEETDSERGPIRRNKFPLYVPSSLETLVCSEVFRERQDLYRGLDHDEQLDNVECLLEPQ
jgi:hypothetical protein